MTAPISAAPHRISRLAFLGRPGWLLAGLTAVAFAVVCFTVLAPWQFGRNAERSTQNTAIAAAADAPVESVDQLLPVGAVVDAAGQWRPVSATGRFIGDRQVVVGLRQNGAGMPAVEVLAPLLLADGSILLVDRGYLDASDQQATPPPATPDGTVTIVGRLQPFQPDPSGRAAVQRGQRTEVRGIDAGSITGLTGAVRGGFVQLTDGSPGVLDPIGVPQLDPGPFLSYAWQWLVFGTMGLVAFGYFASREFADPRSDLDAADNAPAGQPPSRREFDRAELYRQFENPTG